MKRILKFLGLGEDSKAKTTKSDELMNELETDLRLLRLSGKEARNALADAFIEGIRSR